MGFYGAQRCGDADNWLLADHPISDHCHLEDGPDLQAGLDLTGGWHDAGDYLKFTRTTSFSAYALLKAYEAWPESFADGPDGVPDVLSEVRVATDWLIKAHVSPEVLVTRVGGDQDHDLFVSSPYQSTLSVAQGGGVRPVFTDAQADVAGMVAATLARMAELVQPFDPEYAAQCLSTAQSVYVLALANPGLTSTDAPFYQDDGWQDSMMCAAIELHRATGDAGLLAAAIELDEAMGSHGWVVDWAGPVDYCRHSLFEAGHQDALIAWGLDVNSYLAHVSDAPNVAGMAWFGDWGSLALATGAGFSAALYHEATGQPAYADFALSQLNYVMGDNEYDRSFVVGWGKNPPTKPHHANAYGSNVGDWDLSKPFAASLDGALVGGPTKNAMFVTKAGYEDDIEDWVGNEITLDYNTGLVGVAAFGVDVGAEPPAPDPEPEPEPSKRVLGYYSNWAQWRPAPRKFIPANLDPQLYTHLMYAFADITHDGPPGSGASNFRPRALEDNDLKGVCLGPAAEIESACCEQGIGCYDCVGEWCGAIGATGQGYMADVVALKSQNPALKVVVSLGGWTFNTPEDFGPVATPGMYLSHCTQLVGTSCAASTPPSWIFSTIMGSPEHRATFIANLLAWCDTHGFDGVDIDWEFPGFGAKNCAEGADTCQKTADGSFEDQVQDVANYPVFLEELRAAAGEGFIISMAVPAGEWALQFYDFEAIHPHVDWIGIMSYDYHGAWEAASGANAPMPEVKASVQWFKDQGVPADKLVLGLGAYGHGWSGVTEPVLGAVGSGASPAQPYTQAPGFMAYYEVLALLQAGATKMVDAGTQTPFAYNPATQVLVSYDDADSLAIKLQYLVSEGLSGAMTWAVDLDTFLPSDDPPFELQTLVRNTLLGSD